MHTVEESGARGFLFPGSRMISSGGYTHTRGVNFLRRHRMKGRARAEACSVW